MGFRRTKPHMYCGGINMDFRERMHSRFLDPVIVIPEDLDRAALPHNGNGGNYIHATGLLSECARLHEEEVIRSDSYNLKELYRNDKDIKYVVDIGANVGAFSYYISQLYPDAKIIACEPSAECMEWIKKNTHDALLYVTKAIVGDSDTKTVDLNVCRWAGNNHVVGKFDMESWKRYGCEVLSKTVVPATTLMDVIEENNFPQVDLLKIDTEGSEPDILESIPKEWFKNIKYIIGEWHSQADLTRIQEVLKDRDSVFTAAPFFKEVDGRAANGGIYSKRR